MQLHVTVNDAEYTAAGVPFAYVAPVEVAEVEIEKAGSTPNTRRLSVPTNVGLLSPETEALARRSLAEAEPEKLTAI